MNRLTLVVQCIIGLWLGTILPASAATYYFSSAGKDTYSAAQAQRSATPWKSLAKLEEMMSTLQAGDSVLFRRGDVFYGHIQVRVSGRAGQPMVLGAYGSGAQPIIDGSVLLTDWEPTGSPQRWQTTCDSCQTVPALYQGERVLPLGRFPNRDEANDGYLIIRQGFGKNRFTGQGLSGTTSWEGAEAVVRSARWTLDRGTIRQQSGSTLTLAENTTYAIPKNFGFFIQNHPATLDQAGEWSYEADLHRITWFAHQAAPQRATLYAAYQPYVLEIRGKKYIEVNDLTFRRARVSNVYLWGGEHITLNNIRSTQGATDGIQLFNCQRTTVMHSTIDQQANNGLVAKNSETLTIRDNTLTATGTVAGMGSSGDGMYNALTVTGNHIEVLRNTITQTGYVGIDFRGTHITVRNNTVSYFCTVKDDGAGIYTWTRPQQRLEELRVSGNVVLHGGGSAMGTDRPEKSVAEGIYLDDRTHNVEVDHNTVAYCEGSGIYVHNSRAISLHHNTLYDNRVPIKMISNGKPANREMQIRRCQVYNNVLVALDRQQPLIELISVDKDVVRFGTFDENQYVHPFRPYGNFRVTEQLGTSERYDRDFSLRSWQKWAGQDASSRVSPRHYQPFRVTEVLGDNLFANADFNSTTDEWSVWARHGNAQLQWHEAGHKNPGSLQVGFVSLSGQRNAKLLLSGQHGGLTIRAGTYYRLQLSVKSNRDDQPISLILRKSGGDRRELAPTRTLYTATEWQQHEFIFSAEASSSTARLDLQLTEDDGTVWIDHLSLQPVAVQFSEPRDSVRFIYNTEKEPLAAPLSIPRIGTDHRTYVGSAQVPPYRSLVLLSALDASPSPTDKPEEEPTPEHEEEKGPTPGSEPEPEERPNDEPTPEEEPDRDTREKENPDDQKKEGQPEEEHKESDDQSAEEIANDSSSAEGAIVTGLADSEVVATSSLQLYPNPANHQVTLTYPVAYPGDVHTVLINAQGQVVYQQVKHKGSGVHTSLLSLTPLPGGWYTVRVVAGEHVYYSKLIVR